MQGSITPGQIRQNNRLQVYHLIYNKKRISQLEICSELHLSRPTVTGILSQLEEKGLIKKNGFISSSQAGRKAAAYSIAETGFISLGAEIRSKELKILAVNLYGERIDKVQIPLEYHNQDDYYKEASKAIREFLAFINVPRTSVLGLGIAMEAVISEDGQKVLYGKVLDNTGMDVSAIRRHLDIPCALIRTSGSEAVAELWASPDLENAFFLSLSEHLGAALISGHSVVSGKHGRSTSVEHLRMRAGGPPCYCGRIGCMETLISLNALLQPEETPEEFFMHVRAKEETAVKRWDAYLTGLSACIHILHTMFDTDFILGGTLSAYMGKDDLELLYKKLEQLALFEEPRDYLHLSRIAQENAAAGAALPYIWSFLASEDI